MPHNEALVEQTHHERALGQMLWTGVKSHSLQSFRVVTVVLRFGFRLRR